MIGLGEQGMFVLHQRLQNCANAVYAEMVILFRPPFIKHCALMYGGTKMLIIKSIPNFREYKGD